MPKPSSDETLEQRRRMRNNETATTNRSNQGEGYFGTQRLSLPELAARHTSDLELDVLDEFLSQTDIELSPVHAPRLHRQRLQYSNVHLS
ncbi:unnamed protein product [Phytophthora lilii]|uniref:Unnamed protein product n=1 Tax=Phytophthora lilii TaxID=2077276 RepID=A0A9W6WL43_9STRA|nr:unnamed protein product [Phytophthora lilii]